MKSVSVVLIQSFLFNSLGCYNKKSIGDGRKVRSDLETGGDIYVKTKSGPVYFYASNTYKVENDTIDGKGQRTDSSSINDLPEFGKIPLSNIEKITNKDDEAVQIILFMVLTAGVISMIKSVSKLSSWAHR